MPRDRWKFQSLQMILYIPAGTVIIADETFNHERFNGFRIGRSRNWVMTENKGLQPTKWVQFKLSHAIWLPKNFRTIIIRYSPEINCQVFFKSPTWLYPVTQGVIACWLHSPFFAMYFKPYIIRTSLPTGNPGNPDGGYTVLCPPSLCVALIVQKGNLSDCSFCK